MKKTNRKQDQRIYVRPEDYDSILTVQNYKEPMRKVENGFGYLGALSQTLDGKLIQCHVCGLLFKCLTGHINGIHKMSTKEYRERFQLMHTTALISDELRGDYKQKTMEWWAKLTPEEQFEYRRNSREQLKKFVLDKGYSHNHKKTLEAMNKEGTCPDQVLDRLWQTAQKLGKTPTKNEFIDDCGSQRFVHLIYKFYGSYNKAVELLGLPKNSPFTGERKAWTKRTDDELLELLRIFTQENNEVPTATDFRRNYLPDYQLYVKRFGSIENARQLAGCYEFIN